MKKPCGNVIFTAFSALLILLGSCGDFVSANPYTNSQYGGASAPSEPVKPPTITVTSPIQNSAFNTSSLTLTCNASVRGTHQVETKRGYLTELTIKEIYCLIDWNDTRIEIYREPRYKDRNNGTHEIIVMNQTYVYSTETHKFEGLPDFDPENFSLTFGNVPEGNHTLRFRAIGVGKDMGILYFYEFLKYGFCEFNFTIDTTPPKIQVASPTNREYNNSQTIPLFLTADEQNVTISYSLDNQTPLNYTENASLCNLTVGIHNITVYAFDAAGNPSMAYVAFSVVEQPPELNITLIVVVSVVAAGLVCIGAIVYSRTHRQRRLPDVKS